MYCIKLTDYVKTLVAIITYVIGLIPFFKKQIIFCAVQNLILSTNDENIPAYLQDHASSIRLSIDVHYNI